MKVIRFKDFFDLSTGENLRNYTKECILRDNKEFIMEYIENGIHGMIKASSNDGHYFEGQYYDIKPQESVLGDVVFKLYKSPINDKEYFIFFKRIPYKTNSKEEFRGGELIIDRIIEE